MTAPLHREDEEEILQSKDQDGIIHLRLTADQLITSSQFSSEREYTDFAKNYTFIQTSDILQRKETLTTLVFLSSYYINGGCSYSKWEIIFDLANQTVSINQQVTQFNAYTSSKGL